MDREEEMSPNKSSMLIYFLLLSPGYSCRNKCHAYMYNVCTISEEAYIDNEMKTINADSKH